MPLQIPESLSSIRTLVLAVTDHVRPVLSAEADAAINFGYFKGIRALSAARNQVFQSFVDPFTLTPGTSEYDVGLYDPPVWRPIRLLVGSPTGGGRIIYFRYRALTSMDFQEREVAAAGSFSVLLYDILAGQLPGTAVPIITTNFPTLPSTVTVAVASVGAFQNGTAVRIPLAGPVVTYGNQTMPSTYTGVVTNVAAGVLELQPNVTATAAGQTITPLRRRVLKIAPVIADTVSGRLFYQYRPAPLVVDTDLLDPFIAEHRDMVVYYAVSQLLLAVNDADSRRWFEMAQEMRSELMQDLEPLAGQNTEHVDSDIVWGDW